ncbi:hypothetical protein [Sphingomonas bacterium]|uniref:hypothetical protein n=1 Tax=Sphingomonas bacterium TaxID=1895847 RepID=UPI0015773A15|nr:hypothetical protein [Sphingomonas bacterium]
MAVGIGLVALLLLAWTLHRRAQAATGEAVDDEAGYPATATRAWLSVTFRPIRAGLNLLSATSENEIVVTNTGDVTAEDVRVLTRLTSAHTGQEAEIATLYDAPIVRPATPAFTLQPGEQRVLTSIAALPRDAIHTLTAGGRPMFVPIVAVNVTYATAGIDGQFAQAFAIGVERVDSSKLAPFWLDAPPRSFDQVAARPHAVAVER